MKRILVVNVNWLGDVIFSAPVFQALKRHYPQATISCLAVPRVVPILERMAGVDEILTYDEDGRHKGFLGKLSLIQQLRRQKFDAAFFLHRSLTRTLLVWLAGVPIRIGYATAKRKRFLTHPLKKKEGAHRSDEYLNVLEEFDIPVTDRTVRLTACSQERDSMKKRLEACGVSANDKLAVINVGANWELKKWPTQNYAHLIEDLLQRDRWKVVLSSSAEDAPIAGEITRAIVHPSLIDFAGQTTLPQLFALLERADLLVSADSGPLHIANSLGTAVIGVFGPTRPEITGPRGSGAKHILQHDVGCNRKACYYLECQDNVCMKAVSVKDVVDAIGSSKD